MNERAVENTMYRLGFDPAHKGVRYAAAAIDAIAGGYHGRLIDLYAQIGERFGCRGRNVERNIRYSIAIAGDRNPEFYRTLGLSDNWRDNWSYNQLTNKKFFYAMVHLVEDKNRQ